jgi:hypothetical protein
VDLSFYTDFFILGHCDVVCISNSTFSFAASMLNTNASTFFRPHWDLSSRFTPFDPWYSPPVLWFGRTKAKFLKSSWNVVRLTYLTQGFAAVLRTIFYYLPKSHLKVLALRIYLAYQIKALPALAEASYIRWVGALPGRSKLAFCRSDRDAALIVPRHFFFSVFCEARAGLGPQPWSSNFTPAFCTSR